MSTSELEKTRQKNIEWLPLEDAATRYGYAHKESLSRRLRQLRQRGFVADIGHPPGKYANRPNNENAAIILMWPNPITTLIHQDAPATLLDSKRGKRAQKNPRKNLRQLNKLNTETIMCLFFY